MKRFCLNIPLWLGLLLLFGCATQGGMSDSRPIAPLSATPSSCTRLQGKIDALIARELSPHSLAAIKVVFLKTGETLYEMNPNLLVSPASLQKLFIGAAALSYLGPDHSMETSIAISSDQPTLFLRGCGDPLLETADLTIMADTLAAILPRPITYTLVGDTGCFDELYWGKGWMWDDEPSPEAMYLTPLSVNKNTVRVMVTPGQKASLPPAVVTEPPTRYLQIENIATTAAPGGACAITITRPPGDRENRVRVAGTLAADCPATARQLTVWRPELYSLTLLGELLNQAGVPTKVQAMGNTPVSGKKLVAIRHSLGDIVTEMLKTSDNLSGENLLKYLSHIKSVQKGSAKDGILWVKAYLEQKGLATDLLQLVDGSGLSRYNLTTADAVTGLLAAAYADPSVSPFFIKALAIAGRDGTLKERMKETPAQGVLKGKTGSMEGISALAGYTTTAAGDPLAFTMIMQNIAGPPGKARDLQDRLAVLLTTFPSE
ncbi:MAG: D-alanyl-D-alanine carboxypeptidase/D-alanyl-D-alanine-endopeptidase [Proteobacteria bacterium]|nr:D-alanyl-D-alanine carboxypeptidase/D-alanyl-D-alanine-endopeptidase [Pseudomonadota bacterium]